MKLTCPKCAHESEADGKAAEAVCPSCGAVMPVLALAETIAQRPGVSTPQPAAAASETIGLEPAAKEPATPQRFARYEIIREIGRGAFGIVYRARDPQLGRDVALKVLIAGEQASEAHIKRFHAEAQAAAKLRHPNIVPVHDVGHDYLAMDLVEGVALGEALRQRQFTLRTSRHLCIGSRHETQMRRAAK